MTRPGGALSVHGAALVTGGAKRLGREMALALGRAGWDVAVHYNASAEEAERTAAEIRALGRQAAAIPADLRDWNVATALFDAAQAALGPVACLVNSASLFEADDIDSLAEARWNAHFDINLRAPARLSQEFAARLPEGANGAVVNLIDQRVWKLTPQFLSYTASKSALWTLTKTLAQALGPRGVRVNAIGPGPTLRNARQTDEDFDAQRSATILRRGSSPQGVVQALLYLLDAEEVTGQMIAVDGGQHLAWETPDVVGLTE